jgi:Na+/melibiose symporter-like transporter
VVELLGIWAEEASRFLPFLITLAAATVLLTVLNYYFRCRWKDRSELQFRFQLIMLVLTLINA